ncbi:hypothetical protein Hanom_Chr16g01426311 [Helianthus anomalus]
MKSRAKYNGKIGCKLSKLINLNTESADYPAHLPFHKKQICNSVNAPQTSIRSRKNKSVILCMVLLVGLRGKPKDSLWIYIFTRVQSAYENIQLQITDLNLIRNLKSPKKSRKKYNATITCKLSKHIYLNIRER